jgi:hypothetical protein
MITEPIFHIYRGISTRIFAKQNFIIYKCPLFPSFFAFETSHTKRSSPLINTFLLSSNYINFTSDYVRYFVRDFGSEGVFARIIQIFNELIPQYLWLSAR